MESISETPQRFSNLCKWAIIYLSETFVLFLFDNVTFYARGSIVKNLQSVKKMTFLMAEREKTECVKTNRLCMENIMTLALPIFWLLFLEFNNPAHAELPLAAI